jgi:hypothetical protein
MPRLNKMIPTRVAITTDLEPVNGSVPLEAARANSVRAAFVALAAGLTPAGGFGGVNGAVVVGGAVVVVVASVVVVIVEVVVATVASAQSSLPGWPSLPAPP